MRCARCRRELIATPTFIGGKGYGPVCAEKVAPPAVPHGQRLRPQAQPAPKPKRVRIFTVRAKKAKPEDLQMDLLGEGA